MFLLLVILWRYGTGAHFDGIPKTNATWFKRGTLPKHHVNWWSAKPRFYRAVWRWAMIAIPVGWIFVYTHYRFYTLAFSLGASLYIIHHGWRAITRRIPKRVSIGNYQAPAELDDLEVPDTRKGNARDLGDWPPKRKAGNG